MAKPGQIGVAELTDLQIAVPFFVQIAAYEREIGTLREELLKEIGHLEEKKEEAVKAAADCSAEHFQNLQDQFFSESHQLTITVSAYIVSASKKYEVATFKAGVFKKSTFIFYLGRFTKTFDFTPTNSALYED